MTSRFKTVTKFIIGIGLTGILLIVAFRGTDFAMLWEIIQNVKVGWVLTAIPLLFLSHYFRAWRWQLLLVPVKNRVTRSNAFSSLIMGYMINNVLPRAGELFRPYALGRIENISKASSLGSVVLERVIDLISLLLGLSIVFLLYRTTIAKHFPWFSDIGIIIGVACLLLFVLMLMMLYQRQYFLKLCRLFFFPFPARLQKKVEEIFNSFIDGMLIIRERQNFGAIIGLSIAMWIGYIFMAYLPILAFDLGDIEVGIMFGFVLTVVTSISVLVPTPGAAGSYHFFTVETLMRFYGIGREVALGYATLTHAAGYFSVIILGIVYLVRYNIKVRDVLKQVEEENKAENSAIIEKSVPEVQKGR